MGFTFKNISSDTKGITVQTVKEPLTANVKQKIHNPSFRNGSIDFSDVTGQLYYEDKIIEYTCRFKCSGLSAFNTKIADIAAWLTGKGTLVCATGNTYSNARCYGGIDTMPQFYGTYGEFNVSFTVPPFPDTPNT